MRSNSRPRDEETLNSTPGAPIDRGGTLRRYSDDDANTTNHHPSSSNSGGAILASHNIGSSINNNNNNRAHFNYSSGGDTTNNSANTNRKSSILLAHQHIQQQQQQHELDRSREVSPIKDIDERRNNTNNYSGKHQQQRSDFLGSDLLHSNNRYNSNNGSAILDSPSSMRPPDAGFDTMPPNAYPQVSYDSSLKQQQQQQQQSNNGTSPASDKASKKEAPVIQVHIINEDDEEETDEHHNNHHHPVTKKMNATIVGGNLSTTAQNEQGIRGPVSDRRGSNVVPDFLREQNNSLPDALASNAKFAALLTSVGGGGEQSILTSHNAPPSGLNRTHDPYGKSAVGGGTLSNSLQGNTNSGPNSIANSLDPNRSHNTRAIIAASNSDSHNASTENFVSSGNKNNNSNNLSTLQQQFQQQDGKSNVIHQSLKSDDHPEETEKLIQQQLEQQQQKKKKRNRRGNKNYSSDDDDFEEYMANVKAGKDPLAALTSGGSATTTTAATAKPQIVNRINSAQAQRPSSSANRNNNSNPISRVQPAKQQHQKQQQAEEDEDAENPPERFQQHASPHEDSRMKMFPTKFDLGAKTPPQAHHQVPVRSKPPTSKPTHNNSKKPTGGGGADDSLAEGAFVAGYSKSGSHAFANSQFHASLNSNKQFGGDTQDDNDYFIHLSRKGSQAEGSQMFKSRPFVAGNNNSSLNGLAFTGSGSPDIMAGRKGGGDNNNNNNDDSSSCGPGKFGQIQSGIISGFVGQDGKITMHKSRSQQQRNNSTFGTSSKMNNNNNHTVSLDFDDRPEEQHLLQLVSPDHQPPSQGQSKFPSTRNQKPNFNNSELAARKHVVEENIVGGTDDSSRVNSIMNTVHDKSNDAGSQHTSSAGHRQLPEQTHETNQLKTSTSKEHLSSSVTSASNQQHDNSNHHAVFYVPPNNDGQQQNQLDYGEEEITTTSGRKRFKSLHNASEFLLEPNRSGSFAQGVNSTSSLGNSTRNDNHTRTGSIASEAHRGKNDKRNKNMNNHVHHNLISVVDELPEPPGAISSHHSPMVTASSSQHNTGNNIQNTNNENNNIGSDGDIVTRQSNLTAASRTSVTTTTTTTTDQRMSAGQTSDNNSSSNKNKTSEPNSSNNAINQQEQQQKGSPSLSTAKKNSRESGDGDHSVVGTRKRSTATSIDEYRRSRGEDDHNDNNNEHTSDLGPGSQKNFRLHQDLSFATAEYLSQPNEHSARQSLTADATAAFKSNSNASIHQSEDNKGSNRNIDNHNNSNRFASVNSFVANEPELDTPVHSHKSNVNNNVNFQRTGSAHNNNNTNDDTSKDITAPYLSAQNMTNEGSEASMGRLNDSYYITNSGIASSQRQQPQRQPTPMIPRQSSAKITTVFQQQQDEQKQKQEQQQKHQDDDAEEKETQLSIEQLQEKFQRKQKRRRNKHDSSDDEFEEYLKTGKHEEYKSALQNMKMTEPRADSRTTDTSLSTGRRSSVAPAGALSSASRPGSSSPAKNNNTDNSTKSASSPAAAHAAGSTSPDNSKRSIELLVAASKTPPAVEFKMQLMKKKEREQIEKEDREREQKKKEFQLRKQQEQERKEREEQEQKRRKREEEERRREAEEIEREQEKRKRDEQEKQQQQEKERLECQAAEKKRKEKEEDEKRQKKEAEIAAAEKKRKQEEQERHQHADQREKERLAEQEKEKEKQQQQTAETEQQQKSSVKKEKKHLHFEDELEGGGHHNYSTPQVVSKKRQTGDDDSNNNFYSFDAFMKKKKKSSYQAQTPPPVAASSLSPQMTNNNQNQPNNSNRSPCITMSTANNSNTSSIVPRSFSHQQEPPHHTNIFTLKSPLGNRNSGENNGQYHHSEAEMVRKTNSSSMEQSANASSTTNPSQPSLPRSPVVPVGSKHSTSVQQQQQGHHSSDAKTTRELPTTVPPALVAVKKNENNNNNNNNNSECSASPIMPRQATSSFFETANNKRNEEDSNNNNSGSSPKVKLPPPFATTTDTRNNNSSLTSNNNNGDVLMNSVGSIDSNTDEETISKDQSAEELTPLQKVILNELVQFEKLKIHSPKLAARRHNSFLGISPSTSVAVSSVASPATKGKHTPFPNESCPNTKKPNHSFNTSDPNNTVNDADFVNSNSNVLNQLPSQQHQASSPAVVSPTTSTVSGESGTSKNNASFLSHETKQELIALAKQAEEDLHLSISAKSGRAVLIADTMKSTILWVNEASERAFGRLDLVGSKLESLMTPDVAERHAGFVGAYRDRYLAHFRKTGAPVESRLLDIPDVRRLQVVRRGAGGHPETFHVDAYVRTLRLPNEPLSDVPRMMCLEATDSQQFQEDRVRARMFHAALDNVSDSIVIADYHGQIEYINKSCELLCGYPLTALLAIQATVNVLIPADMVTLHEGYLSHFRDSRRSKIQTMDAPSQELIVQRKVTMKSAFGLQDILLRVDVAFNRIIAYMKSTTEYVPHEDFANERLKLLLPASIVKLLRGSSNSVTDITSFFWEFDNKTVMFTDFAGFADWSKNRPVKAVHDRLQPMFSEFEAITEAFGGELIHRIGNAVMVIFGFNGEERHHARYAVACAVELQQWSLENNFHIRIGLHSGSIGAGIYGSNKGRPSFDAWGPVVNIAKRLEAYGEAGNVHFSHETYRALGYKISTQLQQIVREKTLEGVKGIKDGEMTYILPVKAADTNNNRVDVPEKILQVVNFMKARYARWRIGNEETERRLSELQQTTRH